MRMPLLVLAGIAAFAQTAPQPAQQPAQPGVTLRSTTTLVQVNVVARDSKGRVVTDLKKEDFEVLDNGRPQDVAVFAAETAATKAPAAPLQAFPGEVGPPAATRGSAVILLDYLNSGLWPAQWARLEVVRLLDKFDAAASLALYALDGSGIRLIADFGAEKEALLVKIASVVGQPGHCSDNPLTAWEAEDLCKPGEKEFWWFRREFDTLGALDSLADRLSFAAGRKALIWVSTATDVRDQLAQAGMARATPALDAEKERVMRKLNNADVAIYPIDACAIPGFWTPCISHFSAMADYATRTGGVAVRRRNDLDVAMREAAEDVRFTYSLAFYPSLEGDPHDFHQIKVQVRRAGVALKYKQGYSLAAPATTTSASLTEAVPGAEARALAAQRLAQAAGASIAKDVEIRGAGRPNVAASLQLPYFYTAPNVAVVALAMEIGAGEAKFHLENGRLRAELRLDAVATGTGGEVAARFSDTVKLDFATEAEAEAFRKKPYRYERQFRLASGLYNVRVTFAFGLEASGLSEAPLNIGGWDGHALALSGVALSKERRDAAHLGSGLDAASLDGRKALIARSGEVIPSGTSRFQRGELCLAFVEIYEPLLAGANPPKLALQVRVLDRQTGDARADSGAIGVDNLVQRGSPVVPVSFTVPAATLSAGSYRLELKATHSPGGDSVVRTVDFEVE